jgi:hypothetical protein
MINVIDKTCIHDECKTIPIYNISGEKKTIYCSAHKKDGMVNVKSKTCIYEGCKIIPAFNNFGEKIQSIVQHIKR